MANKKKKQAEPVIEQKTVTDETAPTVINVNNTPKLNLWKGAFILLVLFWCFSGVKGCVSGLHEKYTDWKQGLIERLVPTPNPFPDRKKRPDNSDNDNDGRRNDRGIIWRFLRGTGGARPITSWIRSNVPKNAPAKTVYDVADAFYDAADRIAAEPQIDEPSEAVAAARQEIYAAADPSWVPFLEGLDEQANSFGVKSIKDVITFYYTVAGALYDAAPAAPGAAAPSEADAGELVPPTVPGTLPPPAEPAASDASAKPKKKKTAEPKKTEETAPECPDGSCQNGQCPNNGGGYNYGYGGTGPFGWRWY